MKLEETWLSKLQQFAPAHRLPQNEKILRRAFSSSGINRVRSYALGPEGTNIMHAAASFHRRMRIVQKAEVIPCATPEQALCNVGAITEEGVLGIFWTCAVYFRENELFFGAPNTFPFALQEVLVLDVMQLACAPANVNRLIFENNCERLTIAAHPSPLPLVRRLGFQILIAKSNTDAADLVAEGKADLCITTEDARKTRRLATLWEFGSPTMIFFGGVSQHGMALLQRPLADLGVVAPPLPSAA